MSAEQITKLLASEESDTLERKSGFDLGEIRKTIIAFANDLAGRGIAWLIIGQAPDKQIVGLKMGADEAQRKISDIARNQCSPAIPVSVEIHDADGKKVAIVEVRRSLARPHFEGRAWVRIGSTTRVATDAEAMFLRATDTNRKFAMLKKWVDEGKTTVTFHQLGPPGSPLYRGIIRQEATLLGATEDWLHIDLGTMKPGLPLDEIGLGYDYQNDRPEIRHHGATK